MENRAYEFNRLLSLGNLEQLQAAKQYLKRGIIKNAFGLALAMSAGAGLMYAGGAVMADAPKDGNGKGNSVAILLGLAGIFGGVVTAAGGTLLAAGNIDRNMRELDTLGYVINDRAPGN